MNNDKPKDPGVGLLIIVAIVAAVIMSTIMGGFRGGSGGGGGGYSAPSGGPSSSYQGNTYNVTDRQLDDIENGAKRVQHNHDMLDQFNAQHGPKNGGK